MMSAIAMFNWTLNVQCPYCKKIIDLTDDMNDGGQFSTPIFNNQWNDLEGYEIECPECEMEFEIKRIEY